MHSKGFKLLKQICGDRTITYRATPKYMCIYMHEWHPCAHTLRLTLYAGCGLLAAAAQAKPTWTYEPKHEYPHIYIHIYIHMYTYLHNWWTEWLHHSVKVWSTKEKCNHFKISSQQAISWLLLLWSLDRLEAPYWQRSSRDAHSWICYDPKIFLLALLTWALGVGEQLKDG